MIRRLLILTTLIGVILLPAWGITAEVNLVWSAGSAGGGWYQMAGGIAAIISAADPGITIKVVPGGGVQNTSAVETKTVEMAWGLPFMNAAAVKGMQPFDKKHENLRLIAAGMSFSHLHFYVDAESPLKSMDEILGEKKKLRLAITQPGSSDVWLFEKVLEAYKTSLDDLQKAGFVFARGNYAFQANQFKDKNVDGVFTFLAAPGAAVIEASVGRSLKLIPFSEKATKYLGQFGVVPCEIPAGVYPKASNNDKPVKTCCSGSVIMVHKDMSADVAYRLAKAFNDNFEKVRKVHASLDDYRPQNGPSDKTIPLHPGAEKYYKEKGLLK
ncbi:MAG: TAXI family TRAP transporter solute-binding subunit [Thermodesulfobacteriota bacterium]